MEDTSRGRIPDVERDGPATRTEQSPSAVASEKKEEDPFVVKWDGPDDPECPLNTPVWKKW